MLRHVRSPQDLLRCHPEGTRQSAERGAAEDLIEKRYAHCHDARIGAHYADLFTVHACSGEPLAAAGVRPAADGPLFLEAYLSGPVETLLSQRFGADIPRSQIVEIGSLASRSRIASIRLFRTLAGRLAHEGYSHAVVTATSVLRELMAALGFETLDLAPADGACLPDGGQSWGRYYGTQPRVMAGDIARNAERLAVLTAPRPTLQSPS